MNYELAKQLKDAGFPQAADAQGTLRDGGSYLFPDEMTLATPKKKLDAAIAYAPTLSELIQACGNRFIAVGAYYRNQGWYCEILTGRDERGEEIIEDVQGVTPEEAVAKLYLALHAPQTH